jgi:hypothetical protein
MSKTEDVVSSALYGALNAAIVGDGLGGDRSDLFWAELEKRLKEAKAKELEA